jgi:uncharacterized protein YeaO (DUF488 family)
MIYIKRAYEPASPKDGSRILIDRLWPRGLSKEKIKIKLWLKDIAPSEELREWFGHDPEKWAMFKKKYFTELKAKTADIDIIKKASHQGRTTLIYAAKDEAHNNAVALKDFLER